MPLHPTAMAEGMASIVTILTGRQAEVAVPSRHDLRATSAVAATRRQGSQMYRSSAARTWSSADEKTSRRPIGEAGIGRQGRKKRSLENGLKKATPSPPSVRASRRPCEAVLRNTTKNAHHLLTCSHFAERQGTTGQKERESQRVREAAVPEERPVRNADDETQRVDIGQDGADRREPAAGAAKSWRRPSRRERREGWLDA